MEPLKSERLRAEIKHLKSQVASGMEDSEHRAQEAKHMEAFVSDFIDLYGLPRSVLMNIMDGTYTTVHEVLEAYDMA